MQTWKINFTLITALIMILISCQKSIDMKASSADNNNAQTNRFSKCNNCLITSYYDDNFITGYGLNVSYNKYNQPDTVTTNYFGTSYRLAHYNKIGQLIKITFPSSNLQDYIAFKYDWSLLPTRLFYIVPNYKDYNQTDSINAIIYFKYNYKGEMIQMKQTNVWYPGYDITYNYKYDNTGNIKSVTHVSETGMPYTEYVFSSFDNKPNFMTGSIWMRYLLFYDGFDPLYPLLFSRNNAKDWAWHNAFNILGDDESITSIFTYNNEGFANTNNMNVTDNYYGDFTAVRSAFSTCDNTTGSNLLSLPSVKPFTLQSRFKKFNKKIPFIPGNKE